MGAQARKRQAAIEHIADLHIVNIVLTVASDVIAQTGCADKYSSVGAAGAPLSFSMVESDREFERG